MKWPLLILLSLVCLACGGLIPGKVTNRAPASMPDGHIMDTQELVHLQVLEAKYLKEKQSLNLAIVRGMIAEFKQNHPSATAQSTLPDLKKLRQTPAFLSLELTIEHLSHRESVKLTSRHSAFHNDQP